MSPMSADAHEDIISLGKLKTTKRGGDGAVREICDMIYLAKMKLNK